MSEIKPPSGVQDPRYACCEYCDHCQTINDDRDMFCHLKRKIVYEICEEYVDWRFA